jgi:putative glutamine amidotransferase
VSDRRPVVGISTYSVHADWHVWEGDSMLTPKTYVDCVLRAGGVPVLLACTPDSPELIDEVVERVDAIVLVGGEDVCGVRSAREESEDAHAAHNDERDAFEIALARRAWDVDLPLLGICRGAQVLNVSRGGTLIEDLATSGASAEHLIERGTFNPHAVEFTPGSAAGRLFGSSSVVPSHHHQAIDQVGDDLTVTGRAGDEVVETVEGDSRRFTLGVQWHPEEGQDMTVFEALVDSTGVRA